MALRAGTVSYLRPVVGMTSCHGHGSKITSSSHCKTRQAQTRIGHDCEEIYSTRVKQTFHHHAAPPSGQLLVDVRAHLKVTAC